jgi:hypothetical protein
MRGAYDSQFDGRYTSRIKMICKILYSILFLVLVIELPPPRRPRQRNIPLAGTVSNPADYQRQLPAPEAPPPEPTAAPTASNPYQVRGLVDCAQAEQGKIERFLGDKDAGMADAIRWADSDNVNQRVFAVGVLMDIGTPDAVEQLKTLSHDPNYDVAISARIFLRRFFPKSVPAVAKSGGSEK